MALNTYKECNVESNDKCIICLQEFDTDERYCMCINKHYVHTSCHLEYIINQDSEDVKCAYCKEEVIKRSYKFS